MADARSAGARRTFGPTLVAGLAGAGLVAVAGTRAWVVPAGEGEGDAIAQVAALAADASSPASTQVALVVLATWGVVLVTRGGFRRVIAWFGAVAAFALMAVVLLGWSVGPDRLAEQFAVYGLADADVRRTTWSYAAAVGAVVAFGASVVAARFVDGWPAMGRRYDAPAAGSTGETAAAPAEERSNIDIWNSLDEGRDPTQ